MNIKEMMTSYLLLNGYDGLQNDECGCGVDDLMPCGDPSMDCERAFAYRCGDCAKNTVCDVDLVAGHFGTVYSTKGDFCTPEYMEVRTDA